MTPPTARMKETLAHPTNSSAAEARPRNGAQAQTPMAAPKPTEAKIIERRASAQWRGQVPGATGIVRLTSSRISQRGLLTTETPNVYLILGL
jgi:hypothetical protein